MRKNNLFSISQNRENIYNYIWKEQWKAYKMLEIKIMVYYQPNKCSHKKTRIFKPY